jgi:hypothetical protein
MHGKLRGVFPTFNIWSHLLTVTNSAFFTLVFGLVDPSLRFVLVIVYSRLLPPPHPGHCTLRYS